MFKTIAMAKELPYFKFEPNQWENGNIQICSREDKGLFMDLCSMYWSRLGDVPLKLAINKLCGGNASAFDSLIQEKIFTVIDGLICIDFLNEQLDEFDGTSKKNSENAKIGWAKRRQAKEESERNATASNSQCENDAIREEKIREEKIREEENNNSEVPSLPKFNFRKSLIEFGFDSFLIEEWLKVRKAKRAINSKTSFDMFIREVNKLPLMDKNEILKLCVGKSWKGFQADWINNLNSNNNANTKQPISIEQRNAEYLEKTIRSYREQIDGVGTREDSPNRTNDFTTFEILQE